MKATAEIVLRILKQELALPEWTNSSHNSFEVLVATILSQNTSDRNMAWAFEFLSKRFEITPQTLTKANINDIQKAIKVTYLHISRSKAIKQAATLIRERFHGNMQSILSLPIEDARKTLVQIPGVGPKTADVVLLFSSHKPTIPVDTHVNRVAKRLGFASTKGKYEAVQQNLESLYKPDDYLAVHLLFIQHGREYCNARLPLCNECPAKAD